MAKKGSITSLFFGQSAYANEKVLGVDISPHYIRVCQMNKSYGKWTLKNLASVCTETFFTLEDIYNNKGLYIESLRKLVIANRMRGRDAAFAMPVSTGIMKVIDVPEMDEEDFHNAAEMGSIWQSYVEIPGDISQYHVHYEIIGHDEVPTPPSDDPQAPSTMRVIKVLFVAVPLNVVYLYTEILTSAGLNPVVADLRCNLFRHALNTNRDMDKDIPYAFLEFGPDDNYLFVSHQDKFFLYPFEVTPEEKAGLVQNMGNMEYFANFTTHIAQFLNQIIYHHNQQHPEHTVTEIHASSTLPLHVDDVASDPYIDTFITQMSGMLPQLTITDCNFCDSISVPEKFAKKVNAEGKLSAWVMSLGLATRKLDAFDYIKDAYPIDQINLVPTSKQTISARKFALLSNIVMIFAATIVLAVLAQQYFSLETKKEKKVQEAKSLEYVEGTHKEKKDILTKLQVMSGKVTSLETIQAKLPSNQPYLIEAFDTIAKSIPQGVWLEDIEFMKPNIIKIKGNSLDDQRILDFIEQLNTHSAFRKIAIKTMEVKKKKIGTVVKRTVPVKHFQLEGSILSPAISAENYLQGN